MAVRGTTNPTVLWSISPPTGSITNGLFTAPASVASSTRVKVSATSVTNHAQTASATLLLTPGIASNASVTVSPASVTLTGGQPQQFTASVSGTPNDGVTWSLHPSVGTIVNGVYTAPAVISRAQTVRLTAASVYDSTKTASAFLSLMPIGVTVTPASVALGAGATASFSASVTGTSNTGVVWSLNPAVGTLVNGVYTAPTAIGTPQKVTLSVASLADSTKIASATINLTVNTPHFGNDGSELTTYVPGKSTFVRSMFFSLENLPLYASAFRAAQVNTLESGFYTPPASTTSNSTSAMLAWQWAFNGSPAVKQVEAAAQDGFNIILTGDDIARGSPAVYNATRGPSASWPTSPITYAFDWIRSVGKVIGVEMVDEIASQYLIPFPQGQLGQPGGPQTISCVNDLCTVNWPTPACVGNGAKTFIITGATSNPNLNNSVADIYRQIERSLSGFTFKATGVGTQEFTVATDPNLTFQMFANRSDDPGGSDYVHNDAIQDIMNDINAVPGGPPNVTWPAAALSPPRYFAAWGADPRVADYADIYFTYLGSSTPSAYTLSDGLKAFNSAWNNKYPLVQPNEPTLMEVALVGVGYGAVQTPLSVKAFDGNTMAFSKPHGIAAPTVGLTRLNLKGSSNSALDGNYYVYKVVDPSTVQVYRAGQTGPTVAGPTIGVTFFDGQSVTLNFPNAASVSVKGIAMAGQKYCLHPDNFGQNATVTNTTYAPYNGQWYVLPAQVDKLYGTNTCSWGIQMVPLTIGQYSKGGTANLITDNYYHPGVSQIFSPGVTADLVTANIMYAAEKGAAGVRGYALGSDDNQSEYLNKCFIDCSDYNYISPFYNGPDAQARWQGMSNAFNLIHEIEPFLLQPQLPPPDYGPTMVTCARTSSYGTLLMMTSFADSPQVVNIDLTPYNQSGGAGTMYTMNSEQLTQQDVSGTSMQVSFTSGETIAFTFPSGK